jgi:hypothetical protein
MSSIRPPVSENEPPRLGVSMATRSVCASASARGFAEGGCRAGGAGRGGLRRLGGGRSGLRAVLGREQEEPDQDDREAERGRQDQVLALVIHGAVPDPRREG